MKVYMRSVIYEGSCWVPETFLHVVGSLNLIYANKVSDLY